jgi:hypothetical protein
MHRIRYSSALLIGLQAFGIPAVTSIPGQMNYVSMCVIFILVQVHLS